MHIPRPRILIAVALAAIAALLPLAVSSQAAAVAYRAALVGASEVPPTSSTATGSYSATLNEAAKTITWSLTVPAITNATAAHLHFGAVTCACPVVLPMFAAPAGSPAGTINVSGTSGPADLTGPLAGKWDDFVTGLKAGQIYVNAHTPQNPGGEIRGTLVLATAGAAPAQATPAAPKTGNAGQLDGSASAAVTAALLVLAAGVVIGSRVFGSHRR